MTTFCSSSLKYVSSGLGSHSFSEAVYFASLSFLGLISSFHFMFPPIANFNKLNAFSILFI